jgi:hypothetical protein
MSMYRESSRGEISKLVSAERPNKALQPTANPLRGLSVAELGR